MYFSRITLPYQNLELGQLAQLNASGDGPHHLIWRAFDGLVKDKERPCLYRCDLGSNALTFFTVSEHEPLDWDGRFNVETKPYTPKLRSGLRLGFMLRANAVVSRKTPGQKRGQRHDVVMDYKAQHPEAKDEHTNAQIVQRAGNDWLEQRAASHGFSLLQLQADGYQQHRFFKRHKKQQVQFSTIEFSGVLSVEDPDLLRAALFEGLGSTKAYGNGLLMVRPQ